MPSRLKKYQQNYHQNTVCDCLSYTETEHFSEFYKLLTLQSEVRVVIGQKSSYYSLGASENKKKHQKSL